MRESFTSQVRSVLERAQSVARAMNQDFVGTEHLMLGLLDAGGAADGTAPDSPGEAVRAFQREAVDLKDLRNRIAAVLPVGAETPVVTGDLPLSPRAMRALNVALAQAQSAREPAVSTRRVLSALLEEPESVLLRSLKECGVDVDSLEKGLSQRPEHPES